MNDKNNILAALDKINVADLSYQEWINVGMGLQSEGFDCSLWDGWSKSDPRYKKGECDRKWSTFRGSGTPITGATICQMAIERGWEPRGNMVMEWDDEIQYNSFQNATLKENLEAILQLSGIEKNFVGDTVNTWKLTFEPDTGLLTGIEEVISLLPGWTLRENTDGTVGVAQATDSRFEQSSVYIFERDKTCFSYDVEYSDEGTYGKVCVSCKEPDQRLYVTLPPHKWWISPRNKTLYVTVPDGTSSAALGVYANELSKVISISGRVESYVGIFTPQLIVGDRVELVDESKRHSIIGTVTGVRHRFGRGGFITEFTVDSAGRKGKALLKDYVSKLSGGSSSKQNSVVIS